MNYDEQRQLISKRLTGLAGDIACGVMQTFLNEGVFEEYFLPAITKGYGQEYNAPSFWFPEDLASMGGGEPAQYGYIQFEIVDEIENLNFREAWSLFERAAEIYSDTHPDRRATVEVQMYEARKTFDRLIARHEAWKKANGRA